jgi:multidrug efflux pump subunit AcrB
MTLLAILILGTVAGSLIPVSLMPDIDVPRVTVQISGKNTSARQLENTVISPLRRQLMQVAHITDIKSETRDEKSIITLSFDYGADIDFAFIEVNEKIDRAMNSFPRGVARPRVIKASATDIPVYYLNLTLKDVPEREINAVAGMPETLFPVSQKFVELSSFASQVIRKRLEQLPEVAMADISGLVYPELLVVPDMEKLGAIHLNLEQLEGLIRAGNVNLGNLLIRDGQYQYNVRFNSTLSNKRDIEDLYIRVQDRLLQLRDVATVVEHPQARKGLVTFNGKDAVSIAIIKQTDARMGDLKAKLQDLVNHFNVDYPSIEFAVTRDQTRLLEYSISNLTQNLLWGAALAFTVMFLFLKDFKSPLLIGISMPASLIISLIFFHLLAISINIISLSGLVLGLGMMIDNSIIVIDNITQHRERGGALIPSCIDGANEVFRPMLSSMLTSCAVFIPLIFLSGISGALFYDQAVAVATGHFASLLVSVTLIPVYYRMIYDKGKVSGQNRLLNKINTLNYEALYEKSFRWVMRHQPAVWAMVVALLFTALILYSDLPRSKLPPLTRDETLVAVDWNERINVEENNRRIQAFIFAVGNHIEQTACMVGEQQYLLDRNSDVDAMESVVYLKAKSSRDLALLEKKTEDFFAHQYAEAVVDFQEAGNLFNLIFPEEEPPLVARLRPSEDFGDRQNEILRKTMADIQQSMPERSLDKIPWQESMVLRTDPVRMMMYDIPFESLYKKLTVAFSENEVFLIKDNQDFVPVVLGGRPKLINEILSESYVANKEGHLYPVRELVSEVRDYDLKTIIAGQEGEYFPVDLKAKEGEAEPLMERLKMKLKDNRFFEVDFSGSLFSNKALIRDLSVILIISLALLYFILASQFESLLLPLIVLIEVPIDIAGSFLFLKIFDSGINLMSLIGIVVMSGIIINDSILKVDTVNQLREQGYPLMKALLVAGQRRLKPILMTSLTTVLAMSPLFFTSGLGAELQKPLALALTGGMIVGTLVSLYFIPLCYYYLKRGKMQKPFPQ